MIYKTKKNTTKVYILAQKSKILSKKCAAKSPERKRKNKNEYFLLFCLFSLLFPQGRNNAKNILAKILTYHKNYGIIYER